MSSIKPKVDTTTPINNNNITPVVNQPSLKSLKRKLNRNKPLSPTELEMLPPDILNEYNNNVNNNMKLVTEINPKEKVQSQPKNNNSNNSNNSNKKRNSEQTQSYVKKSKPQQNIKPVQSKLEIEFQQLESLKLKIEKQKRDLENRYTNVLKQREAVLQKMNSQKQSRSQQSQSKDNKPVQSQQQIKKPKQKPSLESPEDLKNKSHLTRKEFRSLKLYEKFEKMELESKGEDYQFNEEDDEELYKFENEQIDIDDVDEYYDEQYRESDEDLLDDEEEESEEENELDIKPQPTQTQTPTPTPTPTQTQPQPQNIKVQAKVSNEPQSVKKSNEKVPVYTPKQPKSSTQQPQNNQAFADLEREMRKKARKEKKALKKDQQQPKDQKDQKEVRDQQKSKNTPKESKRDEKLNNNSTSTPKRSRPNKFELHASKEEFEAGLKSSKLFFGTLRVNPKKYNDAYITVSGSKADVYVDGLKDRNRGFHTDIVAFKIIEDTKVWKKRPKSGNTEEEEDSDEELVAIKDTTTSESCDSGTIVLQSSTIEAMKLKNKVEESFNNSFNSNTSNEVDEETGELLIREELKVDKSDCSEEEDEKILFNQPTTNNIGNNNNNSINLNQIIINTESKKSNNNSNGQQYDQNIGKLDEYITKGMKLGLYVTVKVVYIVEAKHLNSHVGLIVDDPNSQIFATFLPVDTTLPKCLIFKESIPQFRTNPGLYKKSLVAVKYVNWKETSTYPSGNFKSMYGECGQIEPETKALLDEFQVDTSVFSKDVMACLPKITSASQFSISKKELERRRDLRLLDIVTIDPDTAKDLDDALHCIPLEDGNFEVGVHIADVSHFVKPNTALDKSAEKRATTVYLVQKAIPMLPSLLSEELCSLNMGVERYAFSVIWKLSPSGEVLDEWFGKSVIKSCSRLTYAAAQAIINDEITNDWNQFSGKVRPEFGPNTIEHITRVSNSVKGLREIAKSMRSKRIENGAFTIHPSKLAFALDEKGNPVSTKVYPIMESNNLVEEFMLLANMRVAEKIAKSFPSNAMLRRHPDPNPTKLENFLGFCAKHGWKIDSSSVTSFGESLRALKDTVTDPRILQAIQMLSVRSMKLAEYFCSADEDEDEWRHYALNVGYYTHFTSPIRRYADVIVHRLLEVACELERSTIDVQSVGSVLKELPSSEQVSKIALHCNEKKLLARKAQERSDKVFLCVLLLNSVTITHAVVLSTGKNYLTAIVPEYGSEQRIYFDQLTSQKIIQSSNYSEKDKSNTVLWNSTETEPACTQLITELSIIKVNLQVNNEKFPIDIKCILVHPHNQDN